MVDHELVHRLPKAADRPTVHASFENYLPSDWGPGAAKKISDYLYSDKPQLSLHIMSFADGTLVSLVWPHTLFDGMGRSAFLQAWTCVLNGEENKVQPFHGFDKDPLGTLGTRTPREPYALSGFLLKGIHMLLFAFFYVFELVWYRREENCIISLPDSYVQSVKRSALAEIPIQPPPEITGSFIVNDGAAFADPPKPFLSDGDIILSILSRLTIQQISSPTSARSVVIHNVYGLRAVLAPDLLPPDKAYVGNAALGVNAILPASAFFPSHAPLSTIASAIRRAIQTQGTREQMEALARLTWTAKGAPQVVGTWNSRLLIFSNWTKAKFFEVDFSGAVIDSGGRPKPSEGEEQGTGQEERKDTREGREVWKQKVGRPTYLHTWGMVNGVSRRYVFIILGKDAVGNWWVSGVLRKATWEKMKKEFESMRL